MIRTGNTQTAVQSYPKICTSVSKSERSCLAVQDILILCSVIYSKVSVNFPFLFLLYISTPSTLYDFPCISIVSPVSNPSATVSTTNVLLSPLLGVNHTYHSFSGL